MTSHQANILTLKGIYMKFRGGDETEGGRVSNVLYENIWMEAPTQVSCHLAVIQAVIQAVTQFAIWIGPAQQSDTSFLCAAHPCR